MRSTLIAFLIAGVFFSGTSNPLPALSAPADTARQEANVSAESSMRQHYDAAYRFQSSGDLPQADEQHRLFLAEALHHVANGRANTGHYDIAVPLYEEAGKLTPADTTLQLDYARASLDAGNPEKARLLAHGIANLKDRLSNTQSAAVLRMLGDSVWALGRHQEALEHFKAAAALDPTFENMYSLEKQELWLGDKENASKLFSAMIASFGDTATLHMDFGLAYAAANDFLEAIGEFKQAILRNDLTPGVHYSLGSCYMSLPGGEEVSSDAEAEFRKELEIQPNDPFSYAQLGNIALKHHAYSEAEIDLKRAVSLSADNSNIFSSLAQLYTETDRRSDAEAALRRSIAATTDPSQDHYAIHAAHYQLARLLIKDGNKSEAKKEAQIAQELLSQSRQQDQASLSGSPESQPSPLKGRAPTQAEIAEENAFEERARPLIAASYNNLGVHAAMSKDYAKAAAYFERAYEWNPALEGLDSNWGFAAYAAHQYIQAVPPLSRVLISHPSDNEVRATLGMSQYLSGEYRGALQMLEPMSTSLGATPLLLLAYADSMVKTKSGAQGLIQLKALTISNPEYEPAHRALGEAYASAGTYLQAKAELERAVQLEPADGEAKYALALDLIALRQAAQSEALLASMAAAGSKDARVYYQLGRLRLNRGDRKSAMKTLEIASKMSPGDAATHCALSEAYQRTQPSDAAREATLCHSAPAKQPSGTIDTH